MYISIFNPYGLNINFKILFQFRINYLKNNCFQVDEERDHPGPGVQIRDSKTIIEAVMAAKKSSSEARIHKF